MLLNIVKYSNKMAINIFILQLHVVFLLFLESLETNYRSYNPRGISTWPCVSV